MNRLGVGPVRAAIGLVFAVLVTFGISGLSRTPTPIHGDEEAAIRLSWRLTGAGRTTCRPVSPEEQADLPAHMRRQEVCEERPPEYRLRVRLNDALLEDQVIRGRGARGDRPLVVYREIPVPPGPARLEVEFVPERADLDLPALRYAGALTLGPREVVLLILDPDTRTLTARGGGTAPARETPR